MTNNLFNFTEALQVARLTLARAEKINALGDALEDGFDNVYSKTDIDAKVFGTANLGNNSVTLGKLQQIASFRVIGNVTGSTATPSQVSVLNEANMASNSASALATQQSIKAYVDSNRAAADNLANSKLSLSGGTMSGPLAMGGNKATGLGAPTASGDAATKAYADGLKTASDAIAATKLPLAGGQMTGPVDMGGNKVIGAGKATSTNDAATLANKVHEFAPPSASFSMNGQRVIELAAPSAPQDAATKSYVDSTAFSSSLPDQAGNAGKVVTTDGSSASWQTISTVLGYEPYHTQVGDFLDTYRDPGTGWLRRDGAIYLRASYPLLADVTPVPLTFSAKGGFSANDVAYGAGVLVAVAYSGGGISTSADLGQTWTARTSGTTSTLRFVYWTGTIFVAGGDGGVLLTSPDGITWTLRTSGTTNTLRDAVVFGSSIYVVGDNGAIRASSLSGSSWASRTSGTISNLNGVTAGNGTLVVVGASIALTSTTGTTYTTRTLSGTMQKVAYGNGRFIAVGSGSARISADNGVTWTSSTSDFLGSLNDIIYSNSGFVIVGSGGILTSIGGGIFAKNSYTPEYAQFGIAVAGTSLVSVGIGNASAATLPSYSATEFPVANDNPETGWVKAA